MLFTLINSAYFLAYTSCGTTSEVVGENIVFKNIVALRPIGTKTVKPHLVGEEYASYFVECSIPRNVNMSTNVMNITRKDSVTAKTSIKFFKSLIKPCARLGF